MADFEKALKDVQAEHDRLTKEFEAAQAKAESAWADAEAKSLALTTFREKYGRVLKALEPPRSGGVTASGDMTIKAPSVSAGKAKA